MRIGPTCPAAHGTQPARHGTQPGVGRDGVERRRAGTRRRPDLGEDLKGNGDRANERLTSLSGRLATQQKWWEVGQGAWGEG